MTSAWILIAAVIILGGLIAALGDRLGTRVGKARLRLFKLRPRQTAMVVTVFTGTLIAASTLGLLFALSESLRQGVFELDDILKKRREIERELEAVTSEKEQVQQQLQQAKERQETARQRLDQINQNFQQTQEQLRSISQQAAALRSEINSLLGERRELVQERSQLQKQANQLQTQVQQLQEQLQQQDQNLADLEQEIAERDQVLQAKETRLERLETQQRRLQSEVTRRDEQIAQLDRAIATKDRTLSAREKRLNTLESQLDFLQREVTILEQYYQNYQDLRARTIALLRGQVLAFGAIRVVDPEAAIPVIEQLLREANRSAIKAVSPGGEKFDRRVVRITQAQVEQLKEQLVNGEEYVVRIISAGNYVQGEEEVRVFADVAPNQAIFSKNEVIATVSIDPEAMTPQDIQQRLDLLFSASQFRARRAGVLGEIQVTDGLPNLVNFIEQLSQYEQPIEEIKALASQTAYTAGPLELRLVALRDGEVVFTNEEK